MHRDVKPENFRFKEANAVTLQAAISAYFKGARHVFTMLLWGHLCVPVAGLWRRQSDGWTSEGRF